MADGLPSPEEFEKWLLPPDALALVEKTYGAPGARVAIMERLHAKIIDAISPSTSFTKGDTEPTHTKELIPVPARYWKYIHDESTFWQNGDAMFFTSDPRTSEAYITRCFGIKLDPADVGTIPHRPVSYTHLERLPPRGDRVTNLQWFWEPVHFKRALGDIMLHRVFLGTCLLYTSRCV